MKLTLVSAPIDFPLAAYDLAAQVAASPVGKEVEVELLHLDVSRLHHYNRKNAEQWRFIARLEASRPDVVAFSVYLWNHLAVRELIGITTRLYPEISIVVGGPEVASAEAARPFFGGELGGGLGGGLRGGRVLAAVHGEGEETLVEILGRLVAGEDLEGVAGCTWRRGDEVIEEAPRAPLRELGDLASPYLTGLVPEDAFARPGVEAPALFGRALLETYRGCYMQCSYCQWGNGTASRFAFPRRRVFGELSWLISRHVAEIWIIDAMFGFKKRLAKEILEHVIAEKAKHESQSGIVCYHNQDFYDPELFDLYREAGVTVEVDLQSTDKAVLDRVGRGKWYTDSFDRHLEAFRRHRVPTSGAADLMIGLPLDGLESFEDSVDFLLRRHMRVNLYQTSIIPQTPMSRTLEEDGTVHAELAPRSVLRNHTFPTGDLVKARLVGHGVDFFRLYPKTARLLYRLGFERPVDLCRRFGEEVWRRRELMFGESHTYDAVLVEEHALIADLVADLCAVPEALPILRELLALERAAGLVAPQDVAGRRSRGRGILRGVEVELGDAWLAMAPCYRREEVEEVEIAHRVDAVLDLLEKDDPVLPTAEGWQQLGTGAPLVGLVYRKGLRHTCYRLVDRAVTHRLLERFSGHFPVSDCLANLLGPAWRRHDLAPLRATLESLARAGFIELESAPAVEKES